MAKQTIDNPRALNQYIDLLGDESGEFIIGIIDTLLDDGPRNFGLLDQSMVTNDFATFRRTAHNLKTVCSTVGASGLAGKFQELEEAGAAADLTSTGGLVQECRAIYRQLEVELRQRKSSLQ